MQMVVNLTPPSQVSKFNFTSGEYFTDGYGEFPLDGVHLITWLIGQKLPPKEKSGEQKTIPPGVE